MMTNDLLTITQAGATARQVTLAGSTVRIGRATANDIILDDPAVGEEHLVMVREEATWMVTDLGSVVGTFLNQAQMLPNVPEPWNAHVSLFIGPYQLLWQPAGERPTPDDPPPLPEPADGQITTILTPSTIEVEAGTQAQVQVDLLNQGIPVDHFHLAVQGIPAAWVTISQPQVQLMPDQKTSVVLHILPPRESRTTAGQHLFTLVAVASSTGREVVAGRGYLTIHPFQQFNTAIHPTHLENRGTIQVAIRNEGNIRSAYTVSATDDAELLNFKGAHSRTQVDPGESQEIPIQCRPRWRHWLGQNKVRPFTVLVRADSGQEQIQHGQLTVQPIIPPWIRPYLRLALVIMLIILAGFFALRDLDQDHLPAILELIWGSPNNSPDGDGDGLWDIDERRFETNPRDPDSDHDQLNDWQELNQYNTSPLLIDSDCDRIPDGVEVNTYGTNPRNPFTNGAGTPDWAEQYPYAPGLDDYACSTPTPMPTPSSSLEAP